MINTGEQEAYILVDRFIETGMPFAMYRIPGEKVIHLMVQLNSDVRLFNDLEELNGRSGFVIAPFRIGSWYFPVIRNWTFHRNFHRQQLFMRLVGGICIPMSIYVILHKPGYGWVVLRKLFLQEKKMNGAR